MADPAYDFSWSTPPAVKSLAKVKRKPEGWTATTPEQAQSIGQQYATPGTNTDAEDWMGGPANPNISAAAPPEANPNLGAPSPTPVPMDGPVVNPNTGAPAAMTPQARASLAQQNWLAQGGSLASMHRASVAAGIRPQIDARATPSPENIGSEDSNSIQAGWGWPSPTANPLPPVPAPVRSAQAQTRFNQTINQN